MRKAWRSAFPRVVLVNAARASGPRGTAPPPHATKTKPCNQATSPHDARVAGEKFLWARPRRARESIVHLRPPQPRAGVNPPRDQIERAHHRMHVPSGAAAAAHARNGVFLRRGQRVRRVNSDVAEPDGGGGSVAPRAARPRGGFGRLSGRRGLLGLLGQPQQRRATRRGRANVVPRCPRGTLVGVDLPRRGPDERRREGRSGSVVAHDRAPRAGGFVATVGDRRAGTRGEVLRERGASVWSKEPG